MSEINNAEQLKKDVQKLALHYREIVVALEKVKTRISYTEWSETENAKVDSLLEGIDSDIELYQGIYIKLESLYLRGQNNELPES